MVRDFGVEALGHLRKILFHLWSELPEERCVTLVKAEVALHFLDEAFHKRLSSLRLGPCVREGMRNVCHDARGFKSQGLVAREQREDNPLGMVAQLRDRVSRPAPMLLP